MNFGKKLSNLIENENLSKKDVAAALGIAPNTLSGYLNNKRQPDLDMLVKIANYFCTSTDYLLDYTSSSNEMDKERFNLILNDINSITSTMDIEQLDMLLKIATNISKYNIEKK